VLGISLITNVIGPHQEVSHADVLSASEERATALAGVIEGVLGAL
jgi:purine nucleoside phosphorylase